MHISHIKTRTQNARHGMVLYELWASHGLAGVRVRNYSKSAIITDKNDFGSKFSAFSDNHYETDTTCNVQKILQL